jgi:hypothetical protein
MLDFIKKIQIINDVVVVLWDFYCEAGSHIKAKGHHNFSRLTYLFGKI